MGCVWQSEYAPEPRFGDVRAHHRAPARHRKPSLWRRAAVAAATVSEPFLAVATARYRLRFSSGRLAPLARWR